MASLRCGSPGYHRPHNFNRLSVMVPLASDGDCSTNSYWNSSCESSCWTRLLNRSGADTFESIVPSRLVNDSHTTTVLGCFRQISTARSLERLTYRTRSLAPRSSSCVFISPLMNHGLLMACATLTVPTLPSYRNNGLSNSNHAQPVRCPGSIVKTLTHLAGGVQSRTDIRKPDECHHYLERFHALTPAPPSTVAEQPPLAIRCRATDHNTSSLSSSSCTLLP